MSVAVTPLRKLKKDEDLSCVGAWLTDTKGDVHAYVQRGMGTVIGQNLDYNDAIQFSDMALCINEIGSIVFQYADQNNECKQVPVPESILREKLLEFLTNLKKSLV